MIRGNCEAGGNATPATRPARLMKLRPFSGSATTLRLSITWPRFAPPLLSNGASAVTVRDSETAPTVSCTSSGTVSPVATRIPDRVNVRKPLSSTRAVYSPGARAGTV